MRVLALALAMVVVAACGSDAWPKTAGDTSCAEWLDKMTIEQRQGLASGILSALSESDGAAQEPGDAVVLRFANAIGGTCAAYRDEKVNKVAAGLYVLADDVKPGSD